MNILLSDNFLKEAKQLSKKYKLLKDNLKEVVNEMQDTRDFGVSLGFNLFKKRVKNSSIPTGKSGGFRIIIFEQLENKIILISIFSKTDKDNLSDEELSSVLKKYFEQDNKNEDNR